MHRRAFTFIEVLVVLGVVAVIAIVVIIVIRPAEILRKSRDSVRLADLKTMDDMLSAYYQAIGGSMGSSSVTYVSIPDPRATSTAGTDCAGIGFKGGGSFHCAASSTFRKVDGTGWIPVNLGVAPYGISIGALPIDPVNTTSSNQYYLYQTDGTNYKIATLPESQAYMATAATNMTPFTRSTLPLGTYIGQFGSSGSGNGQFSTSTFYGPSDIAIDSGGNIYVGDYGNNRVEKFNSGGSYLLQFGSSGPGLLNNPNGMAIDSSGNIRIPNGTSEVKKFDSGGNYLSEIYYPSGGGHFTGPGGIAADSSGNTYVNSHNDNLVRKYNSGDSYGSQFGSGSGLADASDMAIDSSGNIYVVDGAGSVKKFNSAGTYLSQIGSSGSGNGQFSAPQGIAIDTSGNIYIADYGNNRVEKFNSSGVYQSQFGYNGTGNGQFSGPYGIGVDLKGNLYVSDYGNGRVQEFSTGN